MAATCTPRLTPRAARPIPPTREPPPPTVGPGYGAQGVVQPNFVIPEPVVPSDDGLTLRPYKREPLTVGAELHKPASNMAFGRDTAGVHFRRDEVEGITLGEFT
jgi:hypothetical protein